MLYDYTNCQNCDKASKGDIGYKVIYTCKLTNKATLIVDTYFNKEEAISNCLLDDFKEIELRR